MTIRTASLAAAALCLSTLLASAQNRIAQAIAPTGTRRALTNNVNPRAQRAQDLGELPGSIRIDSVSLRFSLTDAQNTALTQLLSDQQNPASARYHQWLTPEAYAAQFGLSDADLAKVTSYLSAEGLTLTSVARSKSFVTVSGTAAQVGRALGTTLHSVSVDGEQHFANLSEPQLPVALEAVTRGITGLNDFRLKPRVKVRQVLAPEYTSSVSGSTYLAPGDLYTIYDINPLLTNSINGAGVTIAVMGQTDISLASQAAFRAASGLAANPPAVKLYGTDPGTSTSDLPEAMLDVEWSGAIAPSAAILYVNSTDVVAGSLTQAIDNNLAPIVTISYGDCEQDFGSANIAVYNQLFRQANAQGQTIVGPGGDSGATDCDYNVTVATQGLAVDFPASSPNVTGVGGTMFNEGTGVYFNASNGSYSGSAISYIPETVWNETATYGSLAGGGGGVSAYFTKPPYQTGTGVPNDFSRDVPDLSLDAATVHDGYLICAPGYCTNGYRNSTGYLDVIGGTSVSTPEFAGMLALLEQKIQARVGNANPVIYGLANSSYSTAVFHDITTGNNAMPCTAGSTGCPSGGTIGYNATTGYDLATGWGSVDAYNMVSDWLLVTPSGVTSTLGQNASATVLTDNTSTVTAGGTITLTATVGSATSGVTTTPTGTVQFLIDNVATGTGVALTNGTATYALATTGFTAGAHTVSASYSGDTVYAGSKSSVSISIVSATAVDFALTPTTATVTATSGQNAPGVTFTAASLNGFTGSVVFQATTTSSALSATSTPSFSINPVTVTATASGSTVLTLSAYQAYGKGGLTLAQDKAPGVSRTGALGGGVALAGLLCLFVPRRRRRWAGLVAVVLSVGALTLSGCSTASTDSTGSAQVKTPVGTYTVLVTATGTSSAGTVTSHNSTLTFVVQ